MSKEIEKLIEQIILAIQKATGTEISDEMVRNIKNKCGYLLTTPEIKITSNPKEFDSNARITKSIYERSSGKLYKEYTHTDILYGNYEPGTSFLNYYNNISTEKHELSDFDMTTMQIALSINDTNEYSNSLVIYVPEVREYEEASFKTFMEKEQKQTLYESLLEKTAQKVPEEELQKLVDSFDFSNGIPEIEVISDPEKFDEATKVYMDIYTDSFTNENALCLDSSTLYGNYKSGSDIIFEHRGSISSISETETLSNFDLNGVQIVLATNTQSHRYYNSTSEKENTSIIIYLPEKEYEERNYRDYIEKRKTHIHDFSEIQDFAKTFIPTLSPETLNKKILSRLNQSADIITDEKADIDEEK